MDRNGPRSRPEEDRQAVIERLQRETARWSKYVDTLLHAFRGRDDVPPKLDHRMEALRNKRDSVETKLQALRRHKDRQWTRARAELEEAQRELRDSWRLVIHTLDRESLFV